MKITFVVLITVAATIKISESSQVEDPAVQKRILECFAESKIPEDLKTKDLAGQIVNPKLKCFNACMMKKKGSMINGKINPDTQLAAAQPESYDMIKEVVNTCSDLANQQTDECEVSYTYVTCLIQSAGAYQG